MNDIHRCRRNAIAARPVLAAQGAGAFARRPHYFFYRHSLLVRATHWFNAIVLFVMLLSGLQIFNAHPALYWGKTSDFDHPMLSLTARGNDSEVTQGITQIGPWSFDTTGVLGASKVDGVMAARGFPDWATIPGPQWLAMGRLWHFLFAWLFVFNGAIFVDLCLLEPPCAARTDSEQAGLQEPAA